MKTHILCGALLGAALCLVSCASSSFPLFLNTNLTQIDKLREYCQQKNITSIEVQKADSLRVAVLAKVKEGKENEAYWMADASTTYYRLAIAKHDLAAARSELAELRESLTAAREQLSTYKEVLNELENLRN